MIPFQNFTSCGSQKQKQNQFYNNANKKRPTGRVKRTNKTTKKPHIHTRNRLINRTKFSSIRVYYCVFFFFPIFFSNFFLFLYGKCVYLLYNTETVARKGLDILSRTGDEDTT